MTTDLLRNDMEKILFTAGEIQTRVEELGDRLAEDYRGKNPLFLGVLKGCFVFMADLMRCFPQPCSMDFMAVSSYKGGTSTTGAVEITKDLTRDIEGLDVVIVEDILDSGVTLNYLRDYLSFRKPASIRIATLLDKPERRRAPVTADYCGFTVPDEFVVGYGLDYGEKYRNLPYIGVLKHEIYS
ncbi:MAG: hypoxanthine phosphoribosyltransferase [Oscillospiraceae bacterium]|nr:hypoxanthine phosphoribosyltransferase [Oscillospiraceae bacterium]